MRNKTIISLILLVVILAFGLTLRMYFWQDDFALLFKLQHPTEPAGSFGAGYFGEGPYKYLATPFVPFYKLLGLFPFGYFLGGLVTYALAALLVYPFAHELFQDKRAGLFTALIFATGYIGSDSMYRVINSWQTNIGVVLALISFWTYTKHLRNGRLKFYFIALVFYLSAIEFVFIRSHSLIVPLLALELVFLKFPLKLFSILKPLVRQAPLWFFFFKKYGNGATTSSSIVRFVQTLVGGDMSILAAPTASVGNLLLPTPLQTKIVSALPSTYQLVITSFALIIVFSVSKKLAVSGVKRTIILLLVLAAFFASRYFSSLNLYWYRDASSVASGYFGFLGIALLTVTLLLTHKRSSNIFKVILLGIIIAGSQVAGYNTAYTTTIFDSTQRYLVHSFIGASLIYGALTFMAYSFSKKNKTAAYLPIVVIVTLLLSLNIKNQTKIVEARSKPTRQFYTSLKKYVPEFEAGSFFYFDVADSKASEFNNFFGVGSMPESTAIAVHYDVDRYDLKLTQDFNELLFLVKGQEIDIDNIYTFYYGIDGLTDTTADTRSLLKFGSVEKNLDNHKIKPLTPVLLSVIATPTVNSDDFEYKKTSIVNTKEKIEIINYLLARKEYYQSAKASSDSSWRFREIENILDNNTETSWWGHRIYWHDNRNESVMIDLGSVKTVNRMLWINTHNTLTPTSYEIETSLDGKSWKTVKSVKGGPERKSGEVVIEEFEKQKARYTRIVFKVTLGQDSPSVAEVEIIESSFSSVDVYQATEFLKDPFKNISNQTELEVILTMAQPLLKIQSSWTTNKDGLLHNSSLPLGKIESAQSYQFVLEPGGTKMDNIKITSNGPVDMHIHSATVKNLSFEEIKDRNLIRELVEN